MKNNLPYTSNNLKRYYKLDSDSVTYIINTDGLKEYFFSSDELMIDIKENDFNIQPSTKNKYFSLETFYFSNNNKCEMIIYHTLDDNDIKIQNIQLNSYTNNHLVDKLLLDCRFTFETEYYRDFRIDENKNIFITKYSIDTFEYNEDGDIISEKTNPNPIIETATYKIDSNGKFIKY